MPKRTDIETIMIIGAGPIVIGQACEFDYSGSQACKALKEEGYQVVLVNSNPATIMTDPELSDRTYIEPLTHDVLERIIEKERPCALLPTLGGQTALNVASELAESGVLGKYDVELIGANLASIKKAEDRQAFKEAMVNIGIQVPKSSTASTVNEALNIAEGFGYPVVVRPAYTLGGAGGGIAYNREELEDITRLGLKYSRIDQVLIEESVIGWKEYELEVMRDCADNVVVICSIENMDPMGVHTGDSITVAPTQTLSDREYQALRDASLKIIREIGVDTGGSNIQFAVHPDNGRFVAIEMNPRVSRSSALASKATGYPIAKIAAKLAVGMTLDEIPNDITKETPASFEPTIDYVVVKIPRFAFEKFPGTDEHLTTQMKSVGEAMAIGRIFEEALQKGVRSLEIDRFSLVLDEYENLTVEVLDSLLRIPNHNRLFQMASALKKGMTLEQIAGLTKIDPWFIGKIRNIVEMESTISPHTIATLPPDVLSRAKRMGFSDIRIAQLVGSDETGIRKLRQTPGIVPSYKMVDTCAAEFDAKTPYFYSTYEDGDDEEMMPSGKRKIAIIGGGPNRIGQGIEFDYCCVHACYALRDMGIETVMINCNPETVSTDYDTSDRLYFEPLTHEDILNVLEREKVDGVIVQLGGQTPLNLAAGLVECRIPIIGTPQKSIDIAEDREKFGAVIDKLGIPAPAHGTVVTFEEAGDIAEKIGYPVLLRPSYVLGGRSMQIVYDRTQLEMYMQSAVSVSGSRPVLIDRYLQNAVEVDVDAICDGKDVYIAGIMEHIEEAGVHSGDSACAIPPQTLSGDVIERIRNYTRALALELGVKGLMNIQYAVHEGEVYILEANPRASRTVPFVSKATGLAMAKAAASVMAGTTIKELGLVEKDIAHVAVKESVFPFIKLTGSDTLLGPEMKSTGEVMGIDSSFDMAYHKAQSAAGAPLPESGRIFISVKDSDKQHIISLARDLQIFGFRITATSGTAQVLQEDGLDVESIPKIREGRPNIIDRIISGEIGLVVNTISGRESTEDDILIRRTVIEFNIPYITTLAGFKAATLAIVKTARENFDVKPLQEYEVN